jgi:peptidoglycan/LPS O-acetylase OafA/YrhL
VHLVTLLVVAALVGAAAVTHVSLNSSARYTPVSFIRNVLLLQAAPGCPAWNPPSWSISVEALAYATFPLTACLLARLTRPRSAVIGALAWLIAGTAAVMAFRLVNPRMDFARDGVAADHDRVRGWRMLWKAWASAGEPRSPRWDAVAVGAFALTVVAPALLPHGEGFALVLTPNK